MERDDGTLDREIARRKRAEAALWESERRFQELVEISEDLMCTHDGQGRILSVNPAMVRQTGFARNELVGRLLLDLLSPETKHEFASYLERIHRDGHADGFLRVVTRDGEERVLQYDNVLRVIESGEIIVFSVAHDVQLKWAEQALRVSVIPERRRLEEQLVQSQKMEAVGRLAGGIAHDFNNLLTTILGYCGLVLERLGEDQSIRPDIEEIEKAGQRAVSLTRQLLAFSRKQIIEPRVLALNAIVEESIKMLRRLIGENIELVMALDPGLPNVRADLSQIEQVLVNLAVNARDAMQDGGRLVIETKNVDDYEPLGSAHREAARRRYVLLAVTDTGAGMDPETQRHIFEPFYTTKERGKGTGLGLATVYGIVKQSGGDIRVHSEIGKGTRFEVFLPRAEEAAPEQGPG